MKDLNHKTPVPINYHMLELIEQMVSPLYQGTDLGLCDVISAMLSGYFIESGGAIMPAVEQFLRQTIPDEQERAARSRRAAKAITYGQYNLNELVEKQRELIMSSGKWFATEIQGYKIKAVDFTYYKRSSVKILKSKGYDSTSGRALPAVSLGIMGGIGQVRDQRVAVTDLIKCGEISENKPAEEMSKLYLEVAKKLNSEELAVFDAGFSLVEAAIAGITNCLIRLAKNCTFGKTEGKIPKRKSSKGRPPTKHQAEIVRPLARQHGDKFLPASAPDETITIINEAGQKIEAEIWHKVYFLERHIEHVKDKALKKKLRQMPLKVIVVHDPNYDHPLILGTPLLDLTATSMIKIYPERWPVEGIPQAGKYLLSGGGGRHYVHHPTAIKRLPALTLVFGSLLKYVAATLPPMRTGFWDRVVKPTYGRTRRLGLL